MMAMNFPFLESYTPTSSTSHRHKELQESFVRSHTARITHARNRATKLAICRTVRTRGRIYRVDLLNDLNVSFHDREAQIKEISDEDQWLPETGDGKNKNVVLNRNWLIDTGATPFPKHIIFGNLDPFYKSRAHLSVKDRNLLHSYFTLVPLYYGTSGESLYCPVREVTARAITENDIWLSAILLLEESRLAKQQAKDLSKYVPILTRRRNIYPLMRTRLGDDRQRTSNETIIGVVTTAIVEWRLGNFELSRKHMRAVVMLLSLRGGMRAIQDISGSPGFVFLIGFVEMECTAYLEGPGCLHKAVKRLTQWLRLLQKWNKMLREVSNDESDNDLYHIDETKMSQRYRYLSITATRELLFSESSTLHWYVDATNIKDRMAEIRCSLVLLYSMNNILWNLRDNEKKAVEFLEDLIYTINRSAPAPVLEGGRKQIEAKSPYLGVLFMICHCITNLGHWKGSDESALRLWEGIEFADLMMLVSPSTRHKIIESMSSWLTTPMRVANKLLLLRDHDLARLAGEIDGGWKSSAQDRRKAVSRFFQTNPPRTTVPYRRNC